tara:strand:+ start:117 stop:533 length:417 start_codon:yes stop_codon:yes gene_type:complete
MANENMEEWQSSVAVIDETVRAVISFLGLGTELHISSRQVSEFLGWKTGKITKSLQRISAIESGRVDKKAVETIPTVVAATVFAAAVKILLFWLTNGLTNEILQLACIVLLSILFTVCYDRNSHMLISYVRLTNGLVC